MERRVRSVLLHGGLPVVAGVAFAFNDLSRPAVALTLVAATLVLAWAWFTLVGARGRPLGPG